MEIDKFFLERKQHYHNNKRTPFGAAVLRCKVGANGGLFEEQIH